jgi:hypothetical protein
MIRFFRSLRQRLLAENKFSRYLLYALGEILLVVIGILIALQINTWNEARRNERLIEDYYCRFLADLNQDSLKINMLIDDSALRLQKSNEFLKALEGDRPDKEKTIRLMLEASSRITYQFNPISAGYDDLKSSGNLNTFTEQTILDQLGTYLQEAKGLAGNIAGNGQFALNEVFEITDLHAIGFIDNEFLKGGIDTTIVKMEALDRSPLTSPQIKELRHLATILIAANYRNILHYQTILADNRALEPLLRLKCTLSE